MKLNSKTSRWLACGVIVVGLGACTNDDTSAPEVTEEAPAKEAKIGATLNEKVELALTEIPEQAMQTIRELHPGFVVAEAEKEFKHDKVYLDIEGELDGREIEFDMLQTETGWAIVEVQRDLVWEQLPPNVAVALSQNAPDFAPKRIIESQQYGTDITVYEFYAVDADGTESRKEVKLEAGVASVLEQEWQH